VLGDYGLNTDVYQALQMIVSNKPCNMNYKDESMAGKKILENINVNAYSSYKANERPVDFRIGDMTIKISAIIDRWIEPDRDCFKVKGDNGKIYSLCWFREKDLWQGTEND
jgi:hypothetical protein